MNRNTSKTTDPIQSPTPRTDEALQNTDDGKGCATSAIYVFASFARELERELHLALDALAECQSARARLSDPVVDARNSIEP